MPAINNYNMCHIWGFTISIEIRLGLLIYSMYSILWGNNYLMLRQKFVKVTYFQRLFHWICLRWYKCWVKDNINWYRSLNTGINFHTTYKWHVAMVSNSSSLVTMGQFSSNKKSNAHMGQIQEVNVAWHKCRSYDGIILCYAYAFIDSYLEFFQLKWHIFKSTNDLDLWPEVRVVRS